MEEGDDRANPEAQFEYDGIDGVLQLPMGASDWYQAIKNAATRTAKAACALKAEMRVALTGTPLENHLGELWSLFRLISPGVFGSLEAFKSRFSGPIGWITSA